METVDLQRADQIESIVNAKDSDEARLSVAESSVTEFRANGRSPLELYLTLARTV